MPTKLLPLSTVDFAVCCSPVTGEVIDQKAAEKLAMVFKALAIRPAFDCFHSSPLTRTARPASAI